MLVKKILIAFVVLVSSLSATAWFFSQSDYESSATNDVDQAQVILYGTPNCHYCKKTRKLLSEHNVAFYEHNINADQQAYSEFKRLGGNGTPLIVANGEIIKGFNKAKLLASLELPTL